MTIHRPTLQKLAFSTFLLVVPLNSAFAQDTTAVAERLKSLLANQGIELAWTGISGDASSMVLEGTTVKPAGETETFPIGNVTLEDVAEQDGGFVIGTISTEAYSRTQDGATVEVSPFMVHEMTLPPDGSTDPLGSIAMYKSAELENLTVKVGDKTAFSMQDFSVDVTPPVDGNALEFSGAADRFAGDLTLASDPKSKAVIEALGYQNISGNMQFAGSWQPTDGRMQLSKYDITVDDAGTFGLTFDFSGYTLDFLKSIQEIQKKMAAQPEGADKSGQAMAMLGLMQQLNFNSATIRFDDDSLTTKVLDYVGKQQGMSGKDIANQAKAIIPFGMAQLNNPELTAQVSAAVGEFLDNPGSLEIAATPASPVPFALIMAGAMSNPAELTRTLGVSVTANQD